MPTRRMHSDSVPCVSRTSHHPGCIFQSSRGQPPRPSGFVQFILCVVRRTCCGSRLAILARHIRSYPLDEVATRQLVIDRHVASLGRRSGGPGRTGRGSHACLVSLLTCSRDGRTLVEWKERRNTILILHESCQSAVQTRALHEPATSGLSLRPIHLMCRATGIAVRRACSRTTHKILSSLGSARQRTRAPMADHA